MSQLNPYLHFKDNARPAMEFYKSVFGGELTLITFKDAGLPGDPSEENNVMHSTLQTGDLIFMASDTPSEWEYRPGTKVGMSLSGENESELRDDAQADHGLPRIRMSLSGENESELRGYWEKLSDGANVMQPLEKAPWGDTFGMLYDRFGIEWMVNITGQPSS